MSIAELNLNGVMTICNLVADNPDIRHHKIYFQKSIDKCRSWSAPVLIYSGHYKDDYYWMGGPGARPLLMSNNKILVMAPAYVIPGPGDEITAIDAFCFVSTDYTGDAWDGPYFVMYDCNESVTLEVKKDGEMNGYIYCTGRRWAGDM